VLNDNYELTREDIQDLSSRDALYDVAVGERLKDRICFEIFPHFARGFILYAQRTGQLPTGLNALPAEERNRLLEPFFSGTLTFLYRLLFLFYAESRDLLPVREVRGYYLKSLEKLKREIAATAGPIEDQAPANIKAAYNELSTALYDRLQDLLHAVYRGDPHLNIPVYNGGLFVTQPDPSDTSLTAAVARFLSACKIPDRQLALGLDRMARDLDEKRQELAFIDYKSLGVRQLGSIYESLLEFKLRIAPEEMVVIKGKKTEEVIPYTEALQKKLPILKEGRGKDARDKTLPEGAVYLENDRRERKATGSYYTPGYIVKYIVEHTVGPILHEKLEALRPVFHEAGETLRVEQAKARALRRDDIHPEQETYKKFREELNGAFFDLKVLDPAMGSGHFLVEAVDYITNQMARFLVSFKWNPVIYELAQTRRDIQAEMEQQGVSIDMSKLTDLNLLKLRVLKSCIYGVDLNPMAVELAKVSLWLECFTLGAPLSFLDHHLKCGNSLIGSSVQEARDALGQDLLGNQFTYLFDATRLIHKAGELSGVSAQEVIASRKAYQGAYDALAPFKRLLDVYTSAYFGNTGARHTSRLYAGAIVANDYTQANPDDRKVIETALSLARAKRFFHWELEFPEVFFNETKRKDNGGFDAVVGNPPYISAPAMVANMPLDRKALEAQYTLLTMKWDLYCAFIEQSCRKLSSGGIMGLIVPSQVLYQDYAKLLRKNLVDTYRIDFVVDHSHVRVFQEATVMTCILIVSKQLTPPGHLINVIKITEESTPEDNPLVVSKHLPIAQSLLQINHDTTFRFDTSPGVTKDLGAKIVSNTHFLGDICYGSVGVVPHSEKEGKPKEHYIFSYMHDAKCKPYIEGKEVDRYTLNWRGRFLQYDYHTVRRPSLPELLDTPKIMLKIVAGKSGLNATVDYSGFYSDHSFVMFTQKYRLEKVSTRTLLLDKHEIELSRNYLLEFLLAILNSTLMEWFFKKNFNSDLNIGPDDAKKFPIRRINFTLSSDQRVYYLAKAKNLYAYCLDKNEQDCLLGFVDHHLSQEAEESDVVHDLLAFLAEEMIRLNKEKWVAQKEFLDWLVRSLNMSSDKNSRKGIGALTGKEKLANYPGDYQKGEPPLATDQLLEILRKNKTRLGISLSNTTMLDRIRKEYEESLQRVLPIKESLQKTDALVDAVVYRLYGLTEKEIRVVEGK
jgi:hypothetical protein